MCVGGSSGIFKKTKNKKNPQKQPAIFRQEDEAGCHVDGFLVDLECRLANAKFSAFIYSEWLNKKWQQKDFAFSG